MLELINFLDCDSNILPVVQFIKNGIFPVIQIVIPIALIVMGSIDLGKAVLSSDDKEIKAATGKLAKRAIAAVAVFFVVTMVSLLMGMFGNTELGSQNAWSACWEAA